MGKERIDKIISSQSMITRSDVKNLMKTGCVTVNGVPVKDPSFRIDAEKDIIAVNSERFTYMKYVYIMMNKPSGVVSASKSPADKTVIDILPESMKRPGLFPAGRLDKDTTGFMLITDDGDFAHSILSPKNHIEKTYIAITDGVIDEDSIAEIENGMILGDTQFMPARIELLSDDETPEYEIVICEGKYHEIKKMISASGVGLLALKRVKMGGLTLDDNLDPGVSRFITSSELNLITAAGNYR